MKNLVIVANFTTLPDEHGNCRFNYIASLAAKEGYNTTLVTSSFSHSQKRQRPQNKDINSNYQIIKIYEPSYKRNISIKRFISHRIWGENIIKYIRNRKDIDIIYCAVPSLTAAYKLSKYSKKKGIKFIIDVQDLWPEAFQMVFNPAIINKIIYYPFNKIANKIYKSADDIITVSNTYADYLSAKNKNTKILPIYLGTDLKKFDKYKKTSLRKDFSQDQKVSLSSNTGTIQKQEGEIWISYSGTLGASYNLEVIMQALSKINKQKITLIIMGNGPKLNKLKKMANDYKINVLFLGRISYTSLCNILYHSDISVNPINKKAAGSIINKHADYTAAGIPIINTQENREFRQLIDKYEMGLNCNNDDVDGICKSIMYLINNPKIRKKMGKNARKCSEELFDRTKTYKQILQTIKRDKKIDTLISAMDIKTEKEANLLVDKTNTDRAIIINQSRYKELSISRDRYVIKTYHEKGLSKSRNNAISLSTGDICHIIDDDVTLCDNYKTIINKAYEKYRDADIICFYIESLNDKRVTKNQKEGLVNLVKTMKISSSQITFKRKTIIDNKIVFDEEFGAGTEKYTSGEDSIFLSDCLKKGLKIIYIPEKIGTVTHEKSTWFNGYTNNYFKTKGAAFYRINKYISILLILQFAIRKKKLYSSHSSLSNAIKQMLNGRKEYKYSHE